jgi:hypothetical protein
MRREAVALNPFGESRQGQVSFPQQASLNGPLFGSKRDLKIAASSGSAKQSHLRRTFVFDVHVELACVLLVLFSRVKSQEFTLLWSIKRRAALKFLYSSNGAELSLFGLCAEATG